MHILGINIVGYEYEIHSHISKRLSKFEQKPYIAALYRILYTSSFSGSANYAPCTLNLYKQIVVRLFFSSVDDLTLIGWPVQGVSQKTKLSALK